MSVDNPLCPPPPSCGELPAHMHPIYIQVCMGRQLVCVWGYSILA